MCSDRLYVVLHPTIENEGEVATIITATGNWDPPLAHRTATQATYIRGPRLTR